MTPRGTAAVHQAAHSDSLEHLARIGLIAYGLVHVLIGWLAFQLAWFGGGGESADQSGALSTLAESPLGGPLLWVLGLGLFALALWQAAELLRWRHGWTASGDLRKKALVRSAKAVVKAVVYVALGVLALQVANGNNRSSEESTDQAAEGVIGLPGGRFLVGIGGLVVLAVAVYFIHKGLTKGYMKAIDTSSASAAQRRWIERAGLVGYPGKGMALLVVGGLLLWAAISYDADKAAGLDGALRTVQDAPLGSWLLTLIAVGLVAFGVFCFGRARFPERE
jgi:Domain of Unknown Function (DUF1206)